MIAPAGSLTPGVVLREHADAATAARELAQQTADRLRAALKTRGRASLVVSGGRSPIAFFHALAAANLEWSDIWVSLADERWVPPSSPDSNEKLVRENLLTGHAAAAHFVPLKTEAAAPEAALDDRTHALAAMPRPFDVLVLGMGDDAHTASLFPGAPGVEQALRPDATPATVAIDPRTPGANHRRISLNLAALLDARHIALLLQGAGKRGVLERALLAGVTFDMPITAILHQSRVPVEVHWSP